MIDIKKIWNNGKLAQQYTKWAKVARFPIRHSRGGVIIKYKN